MSQLETWVLARAGPSHRTGFIAAPLNAEPARPPTMTARPTANGATARGPRSSTSTAQKVNVRKKVSTTSTAVACSTETALRWDAAFQKMLDPSGLAVRDVHQASAA